MWVSFSLKELLCFKVSLHRLVSGCQRVQSCQVQRDGSSVGSFWSNTSGGFVSTYTVGTILSLETCLRASKGGTVYVLPLRVEPYTGQTLIWPAAGGPLRRHHCADLAWGSVGQTPLSGWDRLGMRGPRGFPWGAWESHVTGVEWQWRSI